MNVIRGPRRDLVAVALGGMAGASVRYGLSELRAIGDGSFPWATFAENVGGCLLLGVAMVVIARRCAAGSLVRPLVAVGFLGSFTTFSAFIIEGELMVRSGDSTLAAAYWTASLAAGLVAALVGIAVASRLVPQRQMA